MKQYQGAHFDFFARFPMGAFEFHYTLSSPPSVSLFDYGDALKTAMLCCGVNAVVSLGLAGFTALHTLLMGVNLWSVSGPRDRAAAATYA